MASMVEKAKSSEGRSETSSLVNPGAARIYYLDNLRALAMLLGVYLHGALAYAQPSQSVWLATNKEGSVAIDISIWWIHLFRMSLFFLLSGYFAKLIVEKRGAWKFLGGRALRLILPMVLSYPFLFIGTTVVIVFALQYVPEPVGLIGAIKEAVRNPKPDQPQSEVGTMHLWFVYYLVFFSVLTAIAVKLKLERWVPPIGFVGWGILAFVLLALGAFAGGIPLPAPESFVPQVWPFLFYGTFYLLGWRLFKKEKLIERTQPYREWLLLFGLLLFIPYYCLMPALDLSKMVDGQPLISREVYCLESVLTAILSLTWTWLAILYGQRFLSAKSGLLSFVADSSYWTYLIHLPVVLFLQTLLVPLELNLWLKLLIVLSATWIFCTATYVVFVRYTPIGWVLHGRRSFP